MKKKNILYQEEAREKLKNGFALVTKVVSITLGPKGRNVVIGKKFGSPQIVNDGVTIASEINLSSKLENIGASLICQAAKKTNEITGDGTTTATIIAYEIIKHGMKVVSSGANPITIKMGIEKSTKFIINQILESATPVSSLEEIVSIASISSGNDNEVGLLIGDAVRKVGPEGLVTLEEGKSITSSLIFNEGMTFAKGFISSYFVSNKEKVESVLDNPLVLLVDKTIKSIKDELLPILEFCYYYKRPVLLICESIRREPLATMILNSIKGKIRIIAVKSPGFGDRKIELLEDLSILTGSQIFGSKTGLNISDIDIYHAGSVKRVIVRKESTTIITKKDTQLNVLSRCKQLKRRLEITGSSYEKSIIKERITRLSGGVAIVRVGALTETEMKDKKLRYEDAINATKAAIDEGVLPGGGSSLAHIAKRLNRWSKFNLSGGELLGSFILDKGLLAPLKKIAENSSKSGALVVKKVLASKFSFGYNALTDEIVNMFKEGIIDPAKVTRSTLQNASSIAGMVITTECVVAKIK